MTWSCPTCGRDYPDSSISVPRADDAGNAEGCEICWKSPAGTHRYVRPEVGSDE